MASRRAVPIGELAPLAQHGDDALAGEAIALLGTFADPTAIAALRAVAAGGVPRRRALAAVALALHDRATALREAPPLLASGDPVVALHAACALVVAEPHAPDPVLHVLLRPLAERDAPPSSFADSLRELRDACLDRLALVARTRAIELAAAVFRTARLRDHLLAGEVLLRLAFADGAAPASAHALSPAQRAALAAIASDGRFRTGFTGLGGLAPALAELGLPADKRGLARWLAG